MAQRFNTKSFFDKSIPVSLLDRKTKYALAKYGAYVRRSAQFSMKSRKASAKPGEAPASHPDGKRINLKRGIFFEYDPYKKSVVVGPVRFDRTMDQHVPLLMEKGGEKKVKTKSGRLVELQYASHPYMAPAAMVNRGVIAKAYGEVR